MPGFGPMSGGVGGCRLLRMLYGVACLCVALSVAVVCRVFVMC